MVSVLGCSRSLSFLGGTMTIGIKEMAISVGVLGVKSFILGIIAENKKVLLLQVL